MFLISYSRPTAYKETISTGMHKVTEADTKKE